MKYMDCLDMKLLIICDKKFVSDMWLWCDENEINLKEKVFYSCVRFIN